MKKLFGFLAVVFLIGSMGCNSGGTGGGGSGSGDIYFWRHPADSNDYISFISSDEAAPSAAMSGNGEAVLVLEQANRVYMSEYR